MGKEKKDLQLDDGQKRIEQKAMSEEAQSKAELEKMLDDAPPEMKKVISRMFSMQISSHQESGPLSSRFLETIGPKITEEHIGTILGNSEKSDARQFLFSILIQIRNVLIVIGIIGVFIWLTVFLAKDKETLYIDIVKTIVAFLGGIGIGFGIKSYKNRK
jgi:hypothetical protein